LTDSQIQSKREGIYSSIFDGQGYLNLCKGQFWQKKLKELFHTYDLEFFGGFFQRTQQENNGKITFEPSNRLTSSSGNCTYHSRYVSHIKLSTVLFNRITDHNIEKVKVNGIHPKNRTEALMLTFEHELIHAVLYMARGERDNHNSLFKDVARNLFGHVSIYHGIDPSVLNRDNDPNFDRTADPKIYEKRDFKMGDSVYCIGKKGRHEGQLIKMDRVNAIIQTSTGRVGAPYRMIKPLK
jgi:hypothetical protein